MNRLISLIFVLACCVLTACGGIAVIDAELDESSSDGQGGSSSVSVSSSTTGTGGDVQEALLVKLSASTPQSAIVTSAQDDGDIYTFTVYDVVNPSDGDQVITSVHVAQVNENGDLADFKMITVTQDGFAPGLSTGVTPAHIAAGEKLVFDMTAGSAKIVVPANGSIRLHVHGTMAQVVPGTSVDGVWQDVPRSGHTPALEIVQLESEIGPAVIEPHAAPFMVLRKSELIIEGQPLPSALTDSVQDLISWKVTGAESSVSMVAFSFDIASSPGVTLCNPRLLKNGKELAKNSYGITQFTFNEIHGGYYVMDDFCMTSGSVEVWIRAENDLGPGESATFTLRAQVQGSASGRSVTTQFHRTGILHTTSFYCVGPPVIGLDGNYNIFHALIWSDMSEDPHMPCWDSGQNLTSSSDFIGDAFVAGLSHQQTLTY